MRGAYTAADKKLMFVKRMFYLGKEVLCYLHKEGTHRLVLNSLAMQQKTVVVHLQNAKVGMDKDPKDGKPLIKIILPPSEPVLLLKPYNQSDFVAWYNGIQFSTLNARTKKKLDDFNKAVAKMEQETARADKMDLISFYSGVDAMLKTEQNRTVLFNAFEEHKTEYHYLRELHENIQSYETMCKLGRFDHAYTYARKVQKMVTDFKLEPEEEDIFDKAYADDLGREQQREEVADQVLECDVREMMKSLTNAKMLESLAATLDKAEKESAQPILDTGIMAELLRALTEKFKQIHTELCVRRFGKLSSYDLRLIAIPMTRYKKTLGWTTPAVLKELGMAQDQRLMMKKAASVLGPQRDDPGFTMKNPVPSLGHVYSSFRANAEAMARNLNKSKTYTSEIRPDNDGGNSTHDDKEDCGILDM